MGTETSPQCNHGSLDVTSQLAFELGAYIQLLLWHVTCEHHEFGFNASNEMQPIAWCLVWKTIFTYDLWHIRSLMLTACVGAQCLRIQCIKCIWWLKGICFSLGGWCMVRPMGTIPWLTFQTKAVIKRIGWG